MMNILHPFTRVSRFHSTSHAARYVVDFIDELDWIVGEVMEAPETAGVTGNTLLVFTSDDGGMLDRARLATQTSSEWRSSGIQV